MNRDHTLFRPPSEAYSLILRIADGCPWNRCTFCGMYKEVPYRFQSLEEVGVQVSNAGETWPDAGRVFLADGDVMALPFEHLRSVLQLLNERFPKLARVNMYANGDSIRRKTDGQLRELHALKLNTLYMGLESGHDPTLKAVRKRETAAEMAEAANRAQACGLRMSTMLLIGLGGQAHSAEHADATAEIANRMNPRFLSALRVIPVPGTALYEEEQAGSFLQVTEFQAVEEIRRIIQGLELDNVIFRANHSSNILPLAGRFPQDKERLLHELDALLTSGRLDTRHPGAAPFSL
ncbi:MAG: radical SAM protein [Kiritimatiellales bacterium]|nr:radical SAM protein [Kiritimatiellales bacterium]